MSKKKKTPGDYRKSREMAIGESGLPLLQEDAIDLIIQRDVTGDTLQDIADQLGIDQSTLWRWRQEKEFNDVLLVKVEEVQRNFLNEAYTSMRTILTNPKSKTHNKLKVIEMVLRNQGRLKDVTENTHEVESSDMEELLDKLNKM